MKRLYFAIWALLTAVTLGLALLGSYVCAVPEWCVLPACVLLCAAGAAVCKGSRRTASRAACLTLSVFVACGVLLHACCDPDARRVHL